VPRSVPWMQTLSDDVLASGLWGLFGTNGVCNDAALWLESNTKLQRRAYRHIHDLIIVMLPQRIPDRQFDNDSQSDLDRAVQMLCDMDSFECPAIWARDADPDLARMATDLLWDIAESTTPTLIRAAGIRGIGRVVQLSASPQTDMAERCLSFAQDPSTPAVLAAYMLSFLRPAPGEEIEPSERDARETLLRRIADARGCPLWPPSY
jgi:hypothetical protein